MAASGGNYWPLANGMTHATQCGMATHTLITLTLEELEAIKDDASARAEDMEWQLRRELARLREVEHNLSVLAGERRPQPPAPPRPASRRKVEELRAALLASPHGRTVARA
jgi:hypothetical protein